MSEPNSTQTAETLARWRERRDGLRHQLAELTRQIADGEQERANLALPAANGEAHATKALDALRSRRIQTEGKIEDLRLALAECERQTEAAEHEHARVLRREIHATAKGLSEARVAAAEKFDAAAKMISEAVSEWEFLGKQLLSLDLPIFQHNPVSVTENIVGSTRLQNAFPKVALRVFPSASGVFAGGGSLAASERNQWLGLPAA